MTRKLAGAPFLGEARWPREWFTSPGVAGKAFRLSISVPSDPAIVGGRAGGQENRFRTVRPFLRRR